MLTLVMSGEGGCWRDTGDKTPHTGRKVFWTLCLNCHGWCDGYIWDLRRVSLGVAVIWHMPAARLGGTVVAIFLFPPSPMCVSLEFSRGILETSSNRAKFMT